MMPLKSGTEKVSCVGCYQQFLLLFLLLVCKPRALFTYLFISGGTGFLIIVPCTPLAFSVTGVKNTYANLAEAYFC